MRRMAVSSSEVIFLPKSDIDQTGGLEHALVPLGGVQKGSFVAYCQPLDTERGFRHSIQAGPDQHTWKDERGRSKMELPQGIDSKFRFILVAAKRAHQLIGGAKPLVQSESKKDIVIAQREVSAGLVPFMMTDGKGHDLVRAATVTIG